MDGFAIPPNHSQAFSKLRSKQFGCPHTFLMLCSLDVAVFKATEDIFQRSSGCHVIHQCQALSKYELAKIFGALLCTTMAACDIYAWSLAQTGMHKCGIYPLNKYCVDNNPHQFVMAETNSSSDARN